MRTILNKIRVSNLAEHETDDSLYIVDWVQHEGRPKGYGGCASYHLEDLPKIGRGYPHAVRIHFVEPLKVLVFGLKGNAWRPNQGIGQCDAVVTLSEDVENTAYLLVETKYKTEQRDNIHDLSRLRRYTDDAIKQICDTKMELKDRGFPPSERITYGLISFPKYEVNFFDSSVTYPEPKTFGASLYSPAELAELYERTQISFYIGNEVTFVHAACIELGNTKPA